MDIGCAIFLVYAGVFSLSIVILIFFMKCLYPNHQTNHNHDELSKKLHQQHQKDMKLMEEIDEIDENGEPW